MSLNMLNATVKKCPNVGDSGNECPRFIEKKFDSIIPCFINSCSKCVAIHDSIYNEDHYHSNLKKFSLERFNDDDMIIITNEEKLKFDFGYQDGEAILPEINKKVLPIDMIKKDLFSISDIVDYKIKNNIYVITENNHLQCFDHFGKLLKSKGNCATKILTVSDNEQYLVIINGTTKILDNNFDLIMDLDDIIKTKFSWDENTYVYHILTGFQFIKNRDKDYIVIRYYNGVFIVDLETKKIIKEVNLWVHQIISPDYKYLIGHDIAVDDSRETIYYNIDEIIHNEPKKYLLDHIYEPALELCRTWINDHTILIEYSEQVWAIYDFNDKIPYNKYLSFRDYTHQLRNQGYIFIDCDRIVDRNVKMFFDKYIITSDKRGTRLFDLQNNLVFENDVFLDNYDNGCIKLEGKTFVKHKLVNKLKNDYFGLIYKKFGRFMTRRICSFL
jgi:hypothetical protein